MTIMTRGGAETWWKEKLPPEVKYLYKYHAYEPWKAVTWSEIFAERKERQECRLRSKRSAAVISPAFVWVFKNRDFPFGGWWIYIKTLKEDYAINFRSRDQHNILEKAMNLFPCGVIPVKENFERWAIAFGREFRHVGFKRKKNQGLAKCLCRIEHGQITDLWNCKNHHSTKNPS